MYGKTNIIPGMFFDKFVIFHNAQQYIMYSCVFFILENYELFSKNVSLKFSHVKKVIFTFTFLGFGASSFFFILWSGVSAVVNHYHYYLRYISSTIVHASKYRTLAHKLFDSNKDVHKGKDYGMYHLGIFDGAKGHVSNHFLEYFLEVAQKRSKTFDIKIKEPQPYCYYYLVNLDVAFMLFTLF
ncbi:hypothetical protein ACJX0J_023858 [Zea mays]